MKMMVDASGVHKADWGERKAARAQDVCQFCLPEECRMVNPIGVHRQGRATREKKYCIKCGRREDGSMHVSSRRKFDRSDYHQEAKV
jgi:hypothetical protein